MIVDLTTQAGTYIKEFIHGDFGRTNPNLGSILNCTADILQLDVLDLIF
jgi:tRNA pseudouridine synthase 10